MKLIGWFGLRLRVVVGLALFSVGMHAAPILEYLFDETGDTVVNTGSSGAAGDGLLNSVSRSGENQPLALGSSISLTGSSSFVRVQDFFSYGGQVTVEA